MYLQSSAINMEDPLYNLSFPSSIGSVMHAVRNGCLTSPYGDYAKAYRNRNLYPYVHRIRTYTDIRYSRIVYPFIQACTWLFQETALDTCVETHAELLGFRF